ncbi:MAG: hypothetical protein ABI882_13840 [Acidobacteriota bacterium]
MNRVSILVSSCDRLSDCWMPFFHGLRKYWPTCPYPVFFISNTRGFIHEGFTSIKTGEDLGWSRNLLLALDQVETPYLLYLQEDYWISERVNGAAIADYVALMEENNLSYVRLVALPPPDGDFDGDDRLGIIGDTDGYRASLQASLWRKDVLRTLIDPNETPWEFEWNGTERSRKYRGTFLSVKPRASDPFYYGIRYVCTAVIRGRWSSEAGEYAKGEGIDVDFSQRLGPQRY